jgi:hypothetical protein
MQSSKRKTGSALAMGVALAFAFIVICVALFYVSMYFGGERETKNASDSGALNVGKQTATFSVQLQGGDEQQFNDVAEVNGTTIPTPETPGTDVSLRNVNRIWAKAFLCALNSEAMGGDGDSHVQSLQAAANAISDRLADALDDPNNLKQWYLDFAQANNTKMLGKNSLMDAPDLSQWKQSYLDASWDSNIAITAAQVPSGVTMPVVKVDPNDPSHNYLVGYNDYNVNGRDYWQVPFRFGERPHLVARSECDTAAASPPAWSTHPLPNAFSTLGGTKDNQNLGEQALSWVQTNPQKTYPLAIPSGFIKVKLDTNTIDWEPNGIPYFTGSYGFMPEEDEADPFPLACGTLSADEVVGLEYTTPTLFTGIFALPPIPPMGSATFDALFQRVQEIHPGYSKAAFIALLVATPISTDASDQEFAIYNSSWDVANPSCTLMITPLSAAPSWVNGDPDGTQTLLETEDLPLPNWGMTDLTCYGEWIYPLMTEVTGTRNWTPGTGYGGCLGALEIHRTTSVIYFGDCSCP